MLTAVFLALFVGEKRRERGQPLLPAGAQVSRAERVGQLLQTCGIAAVQEGIGALLEVDVLLAHALGQPMMLIQTDARGKGKVGAYSAEVGHQIR